MRTIVALACSAVIGLSCDLTGPADFPHAVATHFCGPADGAATGILLARDPIESLQPEYPFVSIDIWQPVSEIGGRTWRLDSGLGLMTARYFRAPGRFEDAMAGSVRIDRVGPDNRVEGSVDLRFPSALVGTEFSAPWIARLMICG